MAGLSFVRALVKSLSVYFFQRLDTDSKQLQCGLTSRCMPLLFPIPHIFSDTSQKPGSPGPDLFETPLFPVPEDLVPFKHPTLNLAVFATHFASFIRHRPRGCSWSGCFRLTADLSVTRGRRGAGSGYTLSEIFERIRPEHLRIRVGHLAPLKKFAIGFCVFGNTLFNT